ncbi:MAG: septum site-determining protein Ssd [Specibacter sp.]
MTTRNSARHAPVAGDQIPAPRAAQPRGLGNQWLPGPGTTVVAISASPALQGEVGRVSAAAGVGLVIAGTVEQSGGMWDGVAAVLLGSDVTGGLPGWHGPTVVVGPVEDSAGMWLQASRLGADRVAVLPDAAQWLANYLTRLRDPAFGAGILGVVGGCGGAGASTMAALLAAGATARGTTALLVDGDRWGGGLDVAVAGQEVPGLRWPDLLNASGAINPEQLAASLPRIAGLSVLSWGAEGGQPLGDSRSMAAASEVMRASRDAYGLVMVDVGRSPEAVAQLGAHCDGFLVVVPGRLRAAAAAAQMVQALPAAPVGVVVRGPLRDGVDADLVAAAVGMPCVGVMPPMRKVGEMLEAGGVLDAARGRRMRKLVDGVLAWMAGGGSPGVESGRRPGRGGT